MSKVSDQHIIDFATERGCTNVVITRNTDKSGKKIIHVKFTCACGRVGGKK